MASAGKAGAYQRQSWKGGGKGDADPRAARRVRRIVGTFIAVCLLAVFLWLLLRRPAVPTSYVLCAGVGDYNVWKAPPLPFVDATLSDFSALAALKPAAAWKLVCPKPRSIDSKTSPLSADFDLETGGLSPETDIVIVYLAAHGIPKTAEGGDEACLIDTEGGTVSMESVLKRLHKSPARIKLLALDAGSIDSDPVRGFLVNEFADMVKAKIDELDYDDVWVLLSHKKFEKSHAAYGEGRSVFGYYVAQGLLGAADTNADGVELSELYAYVQDRVYAYVSEATRQKQTQTPVLYPEVKSNSPVYLMPRLQPATEAQPDDPATDGKNEKPAADRAKSQEQVHRTGQRLVWSTALNEGLKHRQLALFAQVPKGDSAPSPDEKEKSSDAASAAPPKGESAGPTGDKKADDVNRAAVPDATPSESQPEKKKTAAADAADTPAALGGSAATTSSNERMLEELLNEWTVCLGRGDRTRTGRKTSWTPVDYAPRFWLQHIEYLKRYESRWLLGSTAELENQIRAQIAKRKEQVGDRDNGGDDWRRFSSKSMASLEQDSRLREAVQLRDDLLFGLRYYASWGAEKESDAKQVEDLANGLRDLLKALNDDRARQSDSNAWLSDVDGRRRKLEKLRRDLDNRWQTEVDDCLRQPNVADIERLLGLPWVAAEKRRELLSAISTGQIRLVQIDDKLKRGRPRIEATDDRSSWQQARREARLQLKLVQLIESNEVVDGLSRKVDDQSSFDSDLAQEVGAELANAYREPAAVSDVKDFSLDKDQQLRLAAIRGSAVAETVFLASSFPKLVIGWTLKVEPPRPEKTVLHITEDTEIAFVIRGTPPSSRTAHWSLVDYDPDFIAIKEPTTGTVDLAPNLGDQRLTFHVRAKKETDSGTSLRLKIDVAGEASGQSDPISLSLPRPQVLELLVDDDGTQRKATATGRAGLNYVLLKPYPTGKTTFHLALRNPSETPRKVEYQFFKLDQRALSPGELANWTRLVKDDWPPRSKLGQKVTAELPNGGEADLLLPPLDKPQPAAADANVPAKAEAALASPERLPVGNGLFCRVTDVKTNEVTDFWIDLAPLHPRLYVFLDDPRFVSDQRDTIEFFVQRRDARPARDIDVMFRIEPNDEGPQITLSRGKPAKPLRLKLPATKSSDAPEARVVLDVDGYPRAFRYDVDLANRLVINQAPLEPRVEFELPPPDFWLRTGAACLTRLRVDAPENWFNRERYLLVEVADDPTQRQAFLHDRQLVADLLPPENAGELVLECHVGELQTQLQTKSFQDEDIRLAASLVGSTAENEKDSDSRTVRLDSQPPRISYDSLPRGEFGQAVTIQFDVVDQRGDGDGGKVGKVEVDLGTDKKAEMKDPQHAEQVADDRYAFRFEADRFKRVGTWFALVRAVDEAGNTSPIEPIPFIIEAPRPKSDAKKTDEKKPNMLKGAVNYRGKAAARFDVKVSGGGQTRSTTTDAEGKFEMPLPPGTYRLEFSDPLNLRKVFSQKVTVPAASEGPLQQSFEGP